MLLADQKPAQSSSYISSETEDHSRAYLRMARLYYERYTWVLDWSNTQGKTALHIAALKGNEELVRVSIVLRPGARVETERLLPSDAVRSWG
jgi:gamma-glutamylcysteine synthetase